MECKKSDISATKDSITSDSSYKYTEYISGLNSQVLAYLEQIAKLSGKPHNVGRCNTSRNNHDIYNLQKQLAFNISLALNPKALVNVIGNAIPCMLDTFRKSMESIYIIRQNKHIE